MPFEQGTPTFGISDAKIAAWTASGTYSPIVDIMGIQMASTTMQVVTAVANGDDAIVAVATRLIGAQLQMRFVGMNPTALAIITGVSVGVSSSVSQMLFRGGERPPFFACIIKALSEEVGDTWVFLPKCKIMSDFVLFQGEYGAFSTPEVTVQAVPDVHHGIASFITHPTDVPITVMPPLLISSLG
jgi:hypothetical protein